MDTEHNTAAHCLPRRAVPCIGYRRPHVFSPVLFHLYLVPLECRTNAMEHPVLRRLPLRINVRVSLFLVASRDKIGEIWLKPYFNSKACDFEPPLTSGNLLKPSYATTTRTTYPASSLLSSGHSQGKQTDRMACVSAAVARTMSDGL